jgi:hypothetical protein
MIVTGGSLYRSLAPPRPTRLVSGKMTVAPAAEDVAESFPLVIA